jgi:hypothetical protein
MSSFDFVVAWQRFHVLESGHLESYKFMNGLYRAESNL